MRERWEGHKEVLVKMRRDTEESLSWGIFREKMTSFFLKMVAWKQGAVWEGTAIPRQLGPGPVA